jgi:hypothetical protein
MQKDIDILICDIITVGLGLEPEKVVVYSENWDPPKDQGIYIVVSTRRGKPISNVRKYDSTTNEEVQTVVTYDFVDIDITSKDRTALDRKEEVLMALNSTYSDQVQNENNIKIFRLGEIMDLSFIEAASALKRFRIPCIVSNVKEKRTVINYFDKFRNTQEEINE